MILPTYNLIYSRLPYPILTNYYIYGHLFSITRMVNQTLVISQNIFRNLIFAGPLIYMEDNDKMGRRAVVITNNTFENIFGLLGTVIFEMHNFYGPDEDESLEESRSGGIVLVNNRFKDIAGCHQIDTAIAQFSNNRYSNYRNLPDLEQTNYFTLQNIYADSKYNYGQRYSNSPIMTNITFSNSDGQEITQEIQLQLVLIKENFYENVPIALNQRGELPLYAGITIAKGSLYKFIAIQDIKIINENYINIGQLTKATQGSIFCKIRTQCENYWNPGQNYNQSIINTFETSASLLYGFGIQRFRINGNTSFTNIWIQDYAYAMQKQSLHPNFRDINTGLILLLENCHVDLEVGSSITYDKIVFQNLTGSVNEYTAQIYSNWNPNNYNYRTLQQNWLYSNKSDKILYGVGSILFNFRNERNSISRIVIQNCQFDKIYSRANQAARENGIMPMIFSSLPDKDSIPGNNSDIILQDCEFNNLTFEGGANFFELSSKNITLSNLKFKNIGTYDMLQEPFWNVPIVYYNVQPFKNRY